MAEVNAPFMKSRMEMLRLPDAPAKLSRVPSRLIAVIQSAEGSACARLPPIVPRLRIARYAMPEATRASSLPRRRGIGAVLQRGMGDRSAYHPEVSALFDSFQRADAPHIDQECGPGKAQIQHRPQGLSARQHPGFTTGLAGGCGQRRDRGVDIGGPRIGERCRLHRLPALPAPEFAVSPASSLAL